MSEACIQHGMTMAERAIEPNQIMPPSRLRFPAAHIPWFGFVSIRSFPSTLLFDGVFVEQ